ncbi:uncharacterized protein LOC122029089 [Zingiber officinale]|uniref:uncharacterized protein LOC122029089 n=1 Tax=Zingiber officinale TaxID=94328 RepID=UPI001C4D0A4E|nr:uncharacterized protein LOC122029089 [Zingiber officinale]
MWWWWCGRGSVRSIVVKEGEIGSALNLSSLKKSKKKKKKKASKENPYSSLGLDKFSSLLSILEAQRTGIEAESEDAPTTILWFRFTESNDCVPIFKKFKNDTKETGRREMPSESQPSPAEHAQDKNVNELDVLKGVCYILRYDMVVFGAKNTRQRSEEKIEKVNEKEECNRVNIVLQNTSL